MFCGVQQQASSGQRNRTSVAPPRLMTRMLMQGQQFRLDLITGTTISTWEQILSQFSSIKLGIGTELQNPGQPNPQPNMNHVLIAQKSFSVSALEQLATLGVQAIVSNLHDA